MKWWLHARCTLPPRLPRHLLHTSPAPYLQASLQLAPRVTWLNDLHQALTWVKLDLHCWWKWLVYWRATSSHLFPGLLDSHIISSLSWLIGKPHHLISFMAYWTATSSHIFPGLLESHLISSLSWLIEEPNHLTSVSSVLIG